MLVHDQLEFYFQAGDRDSDLFCGSNDVYDLIVGGSES